MVFKLPLWIWSRPQALALSLVAGLLVSLSSLTAHADLMAPEYMKESHALFQAGLYFKAARYAFAASEEQLSVAPEAYSWITLSLMRANLPNAASYFFIRTLQTKDRTAIRRVLPETERLMLRAGADLFRKYLIRYTTYEDYDLTNRSAYLYALGKEALLLGQEERSIGYLNGISPKSPIFPFALQLRGSAYAISGKNDLAIADFTACFQNAADYSDSEPNPAVRKQREEEVDDLKARCQAGEARVLYQAERFSEADRAYDHIAKESLVWPDILFEQAWNSFAKEEYNRTLGKLVSYKSPALGFVFNSEVDVLTAQTYLMLCLYEDANTVINEFNAKYTKVGEDVKRFVEDHSNDLPAFFEEGKKALKDSLYTQNDFHRLENRFVRGPYFQNLVESERTLAQEQIAVHRFDAFQPGVKHTAQAGFPGFLDEVLNWRLKSVRLLGGSFVKNSLIDYHGSLIADFEKVAFIKLEMLSRAKEKLIHKRTEGSRLRGGIEPFRKDYQYFWSFNGEFWDDELGDYVFGLESECRS